MFENFWTWLKENGHKKGDLSSDIINRASDVEAQRGVQVVKRNIHETFTHVQDLLPNGTGDLDHNAFQRLKTAVEDLDRALYHYEEFLNRFGQPKVPMGECPICFDPVSQETCH